MNPGSYILTFSEHLNPVMHRTHFHRAAVNWWRRNGFETPTLLLVARRASQASSPRGWEQEKKKPSAHHVVRAAQERRSAGRARCISEIPQPKSFTCMLNSIWINDTNMQGLCPGVWFYRGFVFTRLSSFSRFVCVRWSWNDCTGIKPQILNQL